MKKSAVIIIILMAVIAISIYVKYKILTSDDINNWVKFWLVFGK